MKKRSFKPNEVTVLNNKPIDIPMDEEREKEKGKRIFSPDEVTVTSEPENEGLGSKSFKQVVKEIRRDIPKAAKSIPFGVGEEIRAFSDILGPKGMYELAKTGKLDSLGDLYRQKRDEYTQLSDEAFRDSIGTSLVVNFFGDHVVSMGAGGAYKGVGKLLSASNKGKYPLMKGAKKAIDVIRPQSKTAQTTVLGGLEGIGHSRGDLTKGEYGKVAESSLLGAGGSFAFKKILDVVGGIGSKPNEKFGRLLGAKAKDYGRKGLGNVNKTTKDLQATGLFKGDTFKNPNVEFDVNTQKFKINDYMDSNTIKANQGFLGKSNHSEIINKNLDEIIEKNSERINERIKLIDQFYNTPDPKGKAVTKLIFYKIFSEMDKNKEDILKALKEKARKGISKSTKSNQKELEEITKRFSEIVKESIHSDNPASALQEVKRVIQGELANEYKGTEIRNEFLITYRKKLATLLKNSINELGDDFFEDSSFSKKNNLIHEAFNAKEMVTRKANELSAGADPAAYYHGNQIGYAQKIFDKVAGSDPMNRARGNLGQFASDNIRQPVRAVNEGFQKFSNQLRLNELIPSNTNSFFNYRNIIYSKLATMNPVMADLIRRNAIDVDKRVSEAFFKQNGPLLLQMLKPTGMIETDEFESFDGVPSEEGRYKYLEKTGDDPDMNVFEKTEKIDRFNRQGTVANIVEREETNPLELLLNG